MTTHIEPQIRSLYVANLANKPTITFDLRLDETTNLGLNLQHPELIEIP